MAIFKCKMCGGALEINENLSAGVCPYCDTTQTFPKLSDEKRTQLYDRANHFRRENEFDKAMGIYEMILSDDKEDCESYWGIVLCRYGIEYVEDPASHKRIPTVNRAQFTSIFEDDDYKNVMKYADDMQKDVYQSEAEIIDKIQKGILAISQKEEPFDIFICYKETDALGNRTQDSVYAQDIYTALTKEGYKVFFAKITLEDKLGSAYEPYIFAALNSAKVMLVVGTSKENFNAVWVKNEWSRYLSLIKQGKEKTLIPVYKDITPYDMPEEFQYLQSQDMGKIGFMQDLIRGVNKLAEANKPPVQETVIVNQGNSQAEPLLKRAFMFLEDGDFNRADEFCEQVLNIDPENAMAYLGKLMAELCVKKQDDLKLQTESFSQSANFQKVLRFGDEILNSEITGYIEFIENRNATSAYNCAVRLMNSAQTEEDFKDVATKFEHLNDFQNSKELLQKCYAKAEQVKREDLYKKANLLMGSADNERFMLEAAERFKTIKDYKDSFALHKVCLEKAEALRKDEILKRGIEKEELAQWDETIYEIAIEIYKTIPGWKDADERLARCEKNYQKQISSKKTKKIISASVSAGIAFAVVGALVLYIVLTPFITFVNLDKILLKSDGTIISTGKYDKGGECDVSKWTNIAKISCRNDVVVGLRSDGTVIAIGENEYGQCDVDDWTNIVDVSTSGSHTVGLKKDGTVIAIGENEYSQCDVDNWTDIVSVVCGTNHTVGLKSDGTVIAVGYNIFGQCDVSSWKSIVAIAATNFGTIGLSVQGDTVEAGNCSLDNAEWTNVTDISTHYNHKVGLKSDGSVVIDDSTVDLGGDITDVFAGGDENSVFLKADGTIVFVGKSVNYKCRAYKKDDIVSIVID